MQPERPLELDLLKMFEGHWGGTAEIENRSTSEVVLMKGWWRAKLEFDGWYLLTREEFEVGDAGKTRGIGTWTWDLKNRTYRVWWFGEGGATMNARASYEERTNSWTFRSKGDGPQGSTRGHGRISIVEGSTMEWFWVEWPRWDVLKLFKTMEMKGTYGRQ